MLFGSVDFAVFLPIVFLIYWRLASVSLKVQNAFVLVSSYLFYGWWDWRYLSLIALSTVADYWVGLKMVDTEEATRRRLLLGISLFLNLGLLGFFKYSNFFIENFVAAFSIFGQKLDLPSLEVVLPVGISFYTFQTLSYTIDVYRGRLDPTRDLVAFAAYVSFFPQLVAGPIERAAALLPQFSRPRIFSYLEAVAGLRQMLWGFFKKVVIADGCAEHVNAIFESPDYTGSTLVVGAVLFAFQIYGDFSGYSDIAIGTAKLFGFELMQNFAFPYFSRDVAEFWRRWHISLSTWFRDYLYFPLGGSRGPTAQRIRNTIVIFVVSGFWHGANWTFIIWGLLNALYIIPLMATASNRQNLGVVSEGRLIPGVRELFQMGVTFGLTCLAWVFFRADTVGDACRYLARLASPDLISTPEVFPNKVFLFVLFMLSVEWVGRGQKFALEQLGLGWPRSVRWGFYLALVLTVYIFTGRPQEFIYFQF